MRLILTDGLGPRTVTKFQGQYVVKLLRFRDGLFAVALSVRAQGGSVWLPFKLSGETGALRVRADH